jgi:hypothetical protein
MTAVKEGIQSKYMHVVVSIKCGYWNTGSSGYL